MAISDPNVIDGVGWEESTRTLVLLMIDSTDWHNDYDHMKLIQKKMNSYVRYYEKKDYQKQFADKTAESCRIELVVKYPYPRTGVQFLEAGKKQLAERKIGLVYRIGTTN